MALTPYCGNCHKFMASMFPDVWVCDCTVSGQAADTSKDPNCHNSGHDHHDPESPIVLGQRAMDEAEEEVEARRRREAEAEEEEEVVDGTPFLDTLAELDEILEDTNRQVDSDCLAYGHIWIQTGKVKLGDQGLSAVAWGPPKCMRCGEPKAGFVAREGPTDRPGGVFSAICAGCGSSTGNESRAKCLVCEPKHKCPGCNLRDLTMKDAQEHIRKLLVEAPNTQTARDAAQWLRMTGRKVRAWEGD